MITTAVFPSPRALHSKVTAYFLGLIGFAGVNELSTAGVPLLSEAGVFSHVSASQEIKWGGPKEGDDDDVDDGVDASISFSERHVMTFTVNTPRPGKMVTLKSTVERGLVEVPFTIYLSANGTGPKAETKGLWRAYSTRHLRHTFTEA